MIVEYTDRYIKISNLLKRWQEMGVNVSEKNEDLEMMLKMVKENSLLIIALILI